MSANARKRIEELYRTYGQATFHRALRRLGDRDAALDLTQEVFKSLLTVADRLEDSERTHRYLFRTTTHAIYKALRKRAQDTHQPLLPESAPFELVGELDSGLSQRLAQLDLHSLEQELAREEWELLVYRTLEELTTVEIGEIFGISDRAVRKRWLRLQDKLKATFQEAETRREQRSQ